MWAKYIRLPSFAQIYPRGMNEADAETARRGDAVIIFDANSKIIPQLCNAKKLNPQLPT
jgi:hypothetical protein